MYKKTYLLLEKGFSRGFFKFFLHKSQKLSVVRYTRQSFVQTLYYANSRDASTDVNSTTSTAPTTKQPTPWQTLALYGRKSHPESPSKSCTNRPLRHAQAAIPSGCRRLGSRTGRLRASRKPSRSSSSMRRRHGPNPSSPTSPTMNSRQTNSSPGKSNAEQAPTPSSTTNYTSAASLGYSSAA